LTKPISSKNLKNSLAIAVTLNVTKVDRVVVDTVAILVAVAAVSIEIAERPIIAARVEMVDPVVAVSTEIVTAVLMVRDLIMVVPLKVGLHIKEMIALNMRKARDHRGQPRHIIEVIVRNIRKVHALKVSIKVQIKDTVNALIEVAVDPVNNNHVTEINKVANIVNRQQLPAVERNDITLIDPVKLRRARVPEVAV